MPSGRFLQFPEFLIPAGAIASTVGGGNYSQIDVSFRFQPQSLTTTSNQTILGTWATNFLGSPANIRGFRIFLSTTGNFHLAISSDGTAANSTTVQSSATIASAGYTNNQCFWARFTWRASDGRVQFFTAADSVTEPTSWTQLGTNQTIAYAQIYNAAGAIWFGQNTLITTESEREPFYGRIYDANIRRTIDGSLHSTMQLAKIPFATSYTTYTDAYGISWTVSVNDGKRGWGIRRLTTTGGTASNRTFLG